MQKRNKILLAIVYILTFVLLALVAVAYKKSNNDHDGISNPISPTPVNEDTETNKSNGAKQSNETEGIKTDEESQPTPTVTNDATSDSLKPSPSPIPEAGPIVLAFAGDVNLDDNSTPVKKYDSENKDISKCLSEDLLKEMIDADIMMLNNEFAFSLRGTKAANKSFTFRANPSRVEILKKMGVDIVSLANNHALDYGQDALVDTFATLEDAKIDYVGAGMNLDRAKAPIYYTVNGKKIAFVAASRVIFAMDWYATDDRPGMVGTYDPAIILESIKEAKANSDYVIVFVHWGIERNNYPEKYQRTLAINYIDAGADAVIGCHPHVMQGFEFYKGKIIAYSLSNFWFSRASVESALLKLHIDTDGEIKPQLLPVMAKNNYTYLITDNKEKDAYFDFIKKLSYNVAIDADGFITATENTSAKSD